MKIKNLVLLLILATLWGPSFLLIKIAVTEIPPMLLASLRIGIAAAVLCLILYVKKEKLSRDFQFWKHVAIAGLFAHAIPFTLFNWGEQYIDSALASILNGLTPLFTIIMAHFMVREEKITIQKAIGTLLGFAGLIVLISPNFNGESNAAFYGILAVSIAAFSYAIAIIYARLNLLKSRPLHAPTSQLLVTAIYLIPLAFFVDQPIQLLSISWQAAVAILILGVFGTAFAFMVYYKILDRAGASFLSLSVYLTPVYGVILGIIFLGESLSIEAIIGAVIILAGLLIANSTISFVRSKKSSKIPKKLLVGELDCSC